MEVMSCSNLPPGFRFHPTDEELITYYLRNQVMSRPCPASIISEVDIYKLDPWQLPEKTDFGENMWYFFTPLEKKYPNGARPNRATMSGYWKATGTDKAIYSGEKKVGVKKTLVFYRGRPPKGIKMNWIMHEYRLTDLKNHTDRSIRLDDWVLCRIYKKRTTNMKKRLVHDTEENNVVQIKTEPVTETPSVKAPFPRICSLTCLLEMDYWAPIPHLLYGDDGTSYDYFEVNQNFSFLTHLPLLSTSSNDIMINWEDSST